MFMSLSLTRKELLRRKRSAATERLLELRKRTARLSEKAILSVLRRDRYDDLRPLSD
jgi:hypothetical protein